MFDNIIHFIDSPNDVDKIKIYNLFQQDGGTFKINFNFNFLLSIILIVIGFLLLYYRLSFKKIKAQIKKVYSYNKILIEYKINDIIFNKVIILQNEIMDDNINVY